MQKSPPESPKIRLDKWLWAARFFKTRSLANDAISSGKVRLNQRTAKPAKEIQVGDELSVRTDFGERTIIVRILSKQRRSASEAALLYEETPESIQKREQEAELRRAQGGPRSPGSGRPTKRDRRAIHQFVSG